MVVPFPKSPLLLTLPCKGRVEPPKAVRGGVPFFARPPPGSLRSTADAPHRRSSTLIRWPRAAAYASPFQGEVRKKSIRPKPDSGRPAGAATPSSPAARPRRPGSQPATVCRPRPQPYSPGSDPRNTWRVTLAATTLSLTSGSFEVSRMFCCRIEIDVSAPALSRLAGHPQRRAREGHRVGVERLALHHVAHADEFLATNSECGP